MQRLSMADVHNIRHLISRGHTNEELSRAYGVAKSTITYWTNPAYRRRKKEFDRIRHQRHNKGPWARLKAWLSGGA